MAILIVLDEANMDTVEYIFCPACKVLANKSEIKGISKGFKT